MDSTHDLVGHWDLDSGTTFLNHGSFGATPRRVLELQSELRRRLEAQPVDFFVRQAPALMDEARAELASFLGADAQQLAFVNNATTGVNSVLTSLDFQPGDELLVTDHAYNACRNALVHWGERRGAVIRVAHLPFPVGDEQEIVDAVLSQVQPRTVLALLDHVTSATGLVLPMTTLVNRLQELGVDVLVDGAHAPGMVPLDLDALGAAYYTGNCHKWLCAPKGAAFLHVRKDRIDAIRPAVISHGANSPTNNRSRFRNEFDWIGTQDPSPWLCVPESLRTMASLVEGGWEEVRRRNRELVLQGRSMLLEALGQAEPAPASMIGSIATVPLPDGPHGEVKPLYSDPLQDRLWKEHRIEVPIGPFPHPPHRTLRISAQLYNTPRDYELLIEALMPLL